MPGRRRQRRTDASKIDATPPWELRAREEPNPTTGPYDERDAPADDLARIDLGALRIPVVEGTDVRVDLDEAQQVVSVTLAGRDGTMQIGVFAAPRNEGIWDDVRAEIAASLRAERRSAPTTEKDGPWGVELHGSLPDQGGRSLPVRFVGVDGPRWFVRAMFVGPVATDPAKAAGFEQALRDTVVVRGADPLPVRDPVPLRLPPGVEVPGQPPTGATPPV